MNRNMNRIIIAGSRGLIGTELTRYLSKDNEIIELDYQLGHDLSDETFVKKIFSDLDADYLVNCFAINDHIFDGSKTENLFDIPLSTITKFLHVNVVSLFSVCRQFAACSKAKGIINFASTYSLVSANPYLYNGGEKNIAYVISKAAVPQLTKHLAIHLAPRIRVNCVVPHGIENNQGEEFKKRFAQLSPSKRLMRKDELNGLIQYLCSENSSYMTGSIVSVDGGWTAW
jgi:NAD(P)-dependent dehydrogenase (short-subunit alcohol dehydrogenase family)